MVCHFVEWVSPSRLAHGFDCGIRSFVPPRSSIHRLPSSSRPGSFSAFAHRAIGLKAVARGWILGSPTFAAASCGSECDFRVQRVLFPHHEDLLLLPHPFRVRFCKVELPEEVGEDQSHFQVGEIAAEAVPGPDRERIEWGTWRP